MAKNNVRVKIPRNPEDLLKLAADVYAKHIAEGSKSALNSHNSTCFLSDKQKLETIMKKSLALLSCLFAFILMSSAQNVAGKINKTNNKINNTDTAVNATAVAINNTSGTLSNAGIALSNLGNTLGGMIRRKPKPEAAKAAGTPDTATLTKQSGNANTVTISIAGADYASLKKLKESLKAVAGVQSVDMNYNSAGSSLSIASNKKADDLWDGLSDDMVAHYNIMSMNDNAINVAYKQ